MLSSLKLELSNLRIFKSYGKSLLVLFNLLMIMCVTAGVYSLCDGPRLSRGPYLTTVTICSISSLIFVSIKASYVLEGLSYNNYEQSYVRAMEIGLFMCSWILAIGHIVVAYRTSCRERRKLLVYKIDIEAVSLSHTRYCDQFGILLYNSMKNMLKSSKYLQK